MAQHPPTQPLAPDPGGWPTLRFTRAEARVIASIAAAFGALALALDATALLSWALRADTFLLVFLPLGFAGILGLPGGLMGGFALRLLLPAVMRPLAPRGVRPAGDAPTSGRADRHDRSAICAALPGLLVGCLQIGLVVLLLSH